MANLARDILVADELAKPSERRQSETLAQLDKLRERVATDLREHHGAKADPTLAQRLATVEWANAASKTPNLREAVADDIERVREAQRGRELPEIPPSNPALSSERTAAVAAAAEAAANQAELTRRETDRAAAAALAAEVERRRIEALRGIRSPEEFTPGPEDREAARRIIQTVRPEPSQQRAEREENER